MGRTSMLEVRVLPWRPRTRVMDPSDLRSAIANSNPVDAADDVGGIVISLAAWVGLIVAAPIVVLLLAALLLSLELPVVLLVALVLVAARFTGLVPWTVVLLDHDSGLERRESYRSILRARQRVRALNGGGPVPVRWTWA